MVGVIIGGLTAIAANVAVVWGLCFSKSKYWYNIISCGILAMPPSIMVIVLSLVWSG